MHRRSGEGEEHQAPSGLCQRVCETRVRLQEALTEYDAAGPAGEAEPSDNWPDEIVRLGAAAAALRGEIRSIQVKVAYVMDFGCHDPAVLEALMAATDAFAVTLDGISSAVSGTEDKTPGDIPGLVEQSTQREKAYIEALNAYARQFDALPIPLP